jgi:hypothetical protein
MFYASSHLRGQGLSGTGMIREPGKLSGSGLPMMVAGWFAW